MHWASWYQWLWQDVCGLAHPFTWYMRMSAQEHPLWWILTPIIMGIAFYLWLWFGNPNWWQTRSEREKRLGWYLGSIALGVAYYVLVCHLWGIL